MKKPTVPRALTALALVGMALVGRYAPDLAWSKASVAVDTLPPTAFLFTEDPDKSGEVKVRKFEVHGDKTITGVYENLGNGHKGPVTGYNRQGTIVLTYAVDNVNSPGLATVILRPIRSESMSETVYVGQQLAPDCSCDGLTEDDAPTSAVAAFLIKGQVPPETIKKAVFENMPPQISTFRTAKQVFNRLDPNAAAGSKPTNKNRSSHEFADTWDR